MPSIGQIRGMLLEEAVLYLLKTSAYRTILKADGDASLVMKGASLWVKGRGTNHQIDAIADFSISQPFSYPQRLLVEAKCYSPKKKVGIEIVRNAVGVLKDVSEWWVPSARGGIHAKGRHHYQYALFSTSGYTIEAQKYAYAQDIYLIPLERSKYMQSIIQAVYAVNHQSFGVTPGAKVEIELSAVRRSIRGRLLGEPLVAQEADLGDDANLALSQFINACHEVGSAVLVMLGKRFPVFLIPAPGFDWNNLIGQQITVHRRKKQWFLSARADGTDLFSFDLPSALFDLYSEQGMLSRTAMYQMKAEWMTEVQVVVLVNSDPRVVTLRLDQEWLEEIRAQIEVGEKTGTADAREGPQENGQ